MIQDVIQKLIDKEDLDRQTATAVDVEPGLVFSD